MKNFARYGVMVGLGLALCVAGCSGPPKDESGFVGYKDAKKIGDATYDRPPVVEAGTAVIVKPANPKDPRFQPDPKLAAAGGGTTGH